MSQYTPTTESVRCAFIADGGWTAEDRAAMFDKWLQEIKAQVWDDALNESHAEGEWCGATRTTCFDNHNPYRS